MKFKICNFIYDFFSFFFGNCDESSSPRLISIFVVSWLMKCAHGGLSFIRSPTLRKMRINEQKPNQAAWIFGIDLKSWPSPPYNIIKTGIEMKGKWVTNNSFISSFSYHFIAIFSFFFLSQNRWTAYHQQSTSRYRQFNVLFYSVWKFCFVCHCFRSVSHAQ